MQQPTRLELVSMTLKLIRTLDTLDISQSVPGEIVNLAPSTLAQLDGGATQMFKINFRQPNHRTGGHSMIVREGLRHYATREEAETQLAIFQCVFPNTLHYIVPA